MSRSAWTHTLCELCAAVRRGDTGPQIVRDAHFEKCCQCGKACYGIFIREDPAQMRCKGVHPA